MEDSKKLDSFPLEYLKDCPFSTVKLLSEEVGIMK